jgi:hypothetical protein
MSAIETTMCIATRLAVNVSIILLFHPRLLFYFIF